MRLLFIGDIFASPGRRIVAESLSEIISARQIDLVIANAENSAGGFGITPMIAEELLAMGVDVLTSGNHIWDKREVIDYLDRQPRLLRPANYPGNIPGRGVHVGRGRNGVEVAVLNLQGRTHMLPIDDPFRKADELLAALEPAVKVILLDFHAEITSEKMAMGHYLDGRVSAVLGTHTHVPTADTRILPRGTAYQTDVGMTGPYDSIIGVEKDLILRRFLTGIPVRMEPARGKVELHSVIVDVDETTGKATGIERHTVAPEG
ncbi:MAG TPA: TIGR00282 family metallophosphoesterase [Bryobacteraceae bacterium]